MSFISVDKELCVRDGVCAETCPSGLLRLSEPGAFPVAVAEAEQRCIACGHCVSVCPRGALSLASMPITECTPLRPELAIHAAQAEQFLRSRRSIRAYRKRAVDRQTLSQLLNLARLGPTAGNRQQLCWYVIDDPDSLKTVGAMVVDQMRHLVKTEAPISDSYPLRELISAWDNGVDLVLRGAPALVVASAPHDSGMGTVDSAIAFTYLDLAAPTLGLGTCWAGFVMLAAAHWPPLREFFSRSLPEGFVFTGAMMVGYPKHRYHRLPRRKPANIVWH